MLRLASLLWRLLRATTMETGLFDMQAAQLRDFKHDRQSDLDARRMIYAMFAQPQPIDSPLDRASDMTTGEAEIVQSPGTELVDPARDLVQCFLRLANSNV